MDENYKRNAKFIIYAKILAALFREHIILFLVTKNMNESSKSKSLFNYSNIHYNLHFTATVDEDSFLHYTDIVKISIPEMDGFLLNYPLFKEYIDNGLRNLTVSFNSMRFQTIESLFKRARLSRTYFEGKVYLGHPFHPLCKTRLPHSVLRNEEFFRYADSFSSELHATVNLLLVAFDEKDVAISGDYVKLLNEICTSNSVILSADKKVIIPMHPVQFKLLSLSQSSVLPHHLKTKPLCNYRTVTCLPESTGYDIKIPVSLQMTSTVRNVSKYAALNGPRLLQWMTFVEQSCNEFIQLHLKKSFFIMKEVAGSWVSDSISCLIRKVPNIPESCVLVPVAFLFDFHQKNKTICNNLTFIFDDESIKDYVKTFCWSFMYILFRFECALECHCQNVCCILNVHKRTLEGLVYRDFGGIGITERRASLLDILKNSPIICHNMREIIDISEHSFVTQLTLLSKYSRIDDFGEFANLEIKKVLQLCSNDKNCNTELIAEFAQRIFSPKVQMKSLLRGILNGKNEYHKVPNVIYRS